MSTYKFSRRNNVTDSEYEARCALRHEHCKNTGHALDMEAVPPDVAEQMRLYNEPSRTDGVWDRGAGETDAEYAERCAHLNALFPTPPSVREARSTADLSDEEMAAMRASRTPPEHDYDAD